MPDGRHAVAVLLDREGTIETSPNSDHGGFIDRCQWFYGMGRGSSTGPVAWCGCAAGYAYHLSGADDGGIASPSTGLMCLRADAQGGMHPKTELVPIGSFVIWCGIHTGLVIRDTGDVLETIEGNCGNAVRRQWRPKDECRVIVTPAALAVNDFDQPAFTIEDRYGFDDLNIKPKFYGPWANIKARNRERDRWLKNHPGWWAIDIRRSKKGEPRYGFSVGRKGTYEETWRYGGWRTVDLRKEKIEAFARREGHKNIRIWHEKIHVPFDSAMHVPAGVDETETV